MAINVSSFTQSPYSCAFLRRQRSLSAFVGKLVDVFLQLGVR